MQKSIKDRILIRQTHCFFALFVFTFIYILSVVFAGGILCLKTVSYAETLQYSFMDGTLTLSDFPEKDAAEYPWYPEKDSIRRVVVTADEIVLGAHIFDGCINLEEVVLTGQNIRLNDYCLAHCPALKHLYFSSPVMWIGTGAVLGSDAISSVILTAQSAVEFRVYASLMPYNLEANGGIRTGLDTAFYYTSPGEGVWSKIEDLTAEGMDIKSRDTDKNGQINISDVTFLLDALATPDLGWANMFDLNGDGLTSISDITALLDALSSECIHTVSLRESQNATCAEEGFSAYYWCAHCGCAISARETVPKNPHTVVSDGAVSPTCTETGLTAGSHCSVCGKVLTAQSVLPANGHTVVIDPAVPATCLNSGLSEGSYCSICGEVLKKQEILPLAGHIVVTDEAVVPTCTETGLTKGSHCSFCGTILTPQSVLPATGHSVVIDHAILPTCTEMGLTSGSHCSVCGAVLSVQTALPATGHTVETDEALAPTCTETGLTVGSHCSVCGAVLSAQTVVPANGHTVVYEAAIEPTCQKAGRTAGSRCKVCGAILSGLSAVPIVDHDYVGGVCTMCGKSQGPSEGLVYQLNPDNRSYSAVSIGTCTDKSVVIPAEYNGLPVTVIGRSNGGAFAFQGTMTSLFIPEGVERIERGALDHTFLDTITLPKSLTFIGDGNFFNSVSLHTVYFNGTLEDWLNVDIQGSPCQKGASLYLNGELLTELTFPAGMTKIPSRSFDGCTSLAVVVIPDGVTVIGDRAFYSCKCDDLYIPVSVTLIEEYALWLAAARIHYAGSEEEWNSIEIVQGVGTGITNVLFNGE